MRRGDEKERGSLTRSKIIEFIRDYRLKNHAIAPSRRDIQAALAISSISTVTYHINVLIRQGRLGEIDKYQTARGLYLTDGSDIPVRATR